MGLDVLIEDEDRVMIERLGDPANCLNRFLDMSYDESTSCLRFIDPYGDTTFNTLQAPVLAAEIETALATLKIDQLAANRIRSVSEAVRLKWQSEVIESLRDNLGNDESHAKEIVEVRLHMRRVLELLARARAEGPHIYVRFLGD